MMSDSPRVPPRFLPTLTEIVQSPTLARAPVRALDPLIEQQVRDLVQTLVAEHLKKFQAALRDGKGEADSK